MSLYHKNIMIILFLLFCGIFTANAKNVDVVIKGIRSSKGRIIIGIYQNEKSFKEDKPYRRIKFEKSKISQGEMTVQLNLKPGTYGFALLDDENDDDKMNYSFIGIPKEGFGFSNYYHSNLTRPKFNLFSFVLTKDQHQKIVCKIKYM